MINRIYCHYNIKAFSRVTPHCKRFTKLNLPFKINKNCVHNIPCSCGKEYKGQNQLPNEDKTGKAYHKVKV